MFKKAIVSILFSAIFVTYLGLGTSHAGTNAESTLAATTATTISAGESVTFSVTYSCTTAWTSATIQLRESTEPSTLYGQPITLTQQSAVSGSLSTTATITFTAQGTYSVEPDVTNDSQGCAASNGAPVTVTVSLATTTVAPTTTAAPTTTIAPTTTKKEKEALPATGSNNGTALLAITILAAGATVILARRRLL